MGVWYHGSPLALDTLAAGSTITTDRELARLFSHKPTLLLWDDDGRRRHDGALPGYLYQIDEPVDECDVEPHPRSTMPPGAEWLTRRPLRLHLLEPTAVRADEHLSPADVAALRARVACERGCKRESPFTASCR
ncbi:MAG: hypothetical protein ACOX3S_14035 [Anaerolineae bacterium]|jgi:hypothetical protein